MYSERTENISKSTMGNRQSYKTSQVEGNPEREKKKKKNERFKERDGGGKWHYQVSEGSVNTSKEPWRIQHQHTGHTNYNNKPGMFSLPTLFPSWAMSHLLNTGSSVKCNLTASKMFSERGSGGGGAGGQHTILCSVFTPSTRLKIKHTGQFK